MASTRQLPGDFGDGRYKVLRRLGEGTTGVVFEVNDEQLDVRVALKVLSKLSAEALFSFKREFRSLSELFHPNIIRLYDLSFDGTECFFTMELHDGEDVLSYLRSGARPFDFARVRSVFLQLATALHTAHDAGRIHRDIKPSNVLVSHGERLVVLDFGVVATVEASEAQRDQEGIVGSPEHMSPEQALVAPVTPAADWYAFGSVLYQVLAGRLPFEGDGMDMMVAKVERAPVPVRQHVPDAPHDLQRLCDELLRVSPDQRLSGADVLRILRSGGGARSSILPPPARARERDASVQALIGRTAAIESFARHVAQPPTGGKATVVLVEGTSGMGKTTFVRSAIASLGASARRFVFESRCVERESVPYKAFDGVMDALTEHILARSLDAPPIGVPTHVRALARLFPVIDRVPAFASAPRRSGDTVDAQQLRRIAFSAIRELLMELAVEGPIVVFLDDLQWTDSDSAVLLRDLLMPPDAPPLVLVLAYRLEGVEQSAPLEGLLDPVRGLPALAHAHVIRVGPLDLDECRTLARDSLDPALAQRDDLVERVAVESRGSPFFLGELVRFVATQPEASLAGVRLESIVLRRAEALPPQASHLLEVVATAGRPTLLSVILRAAEIGGQSALSMLEALRVASLVRASGTRQDDRLECVHDRIREAIVGAMGEGSRIAMHARLARAMIEIGSADPEALYGHFLGAGDPQRAAEYAITAARRSAQALAFGRAAQLFKASLASLAAGDHRRHALHVELGDALTNAGLGASAAEAYVAASASAGDATEREWLRRRAAEELLFAGHVDAGKALLGEVLATHGLGFARTRLRAILRVLFLRVWLTFRGLSFRPRDVSAVPTADLIKLDLMESAATGLVMVDTLLGAPFATAKLLASLRIGEPWRVCRALIVETSFACTAGGPAKEKIDRLIAKTAETARLLNRPDTNALVTALRGTANYFRGEWRAGKDLLLESLTAYEDGVRPMAGPRHMTGYNFSVRWEMATFRYFVLVSLVHLGSLGELEHLLLSYLRDAEERGDLSFSTNLRVGESNFLWLARDEVSTVVGVLDDTMARWSREQFLRQHWLELLTRTQLDLYGEATGETLARMDRNWVPLQRSFLLRIQYFRLRALHLRARVNVALAAKDRSQASLLVRAERDAKAVLAEGMPWAIPLGEMVLAAARKQVRDLDAARAFAERAAAGFDRVDMPLWAHAARSRLGEILGGSEGASLRAGAFDGLRAAGVRNPSAMIRMMAPGFEG